MKVEKISFGGWPNCYAVSNGRIQLIVTADVGPRIISCATPNGENIFKTYTEQLGQSGSSEWVMYGGHRLWHAPEHPIRTYSPDNAPLHVNNEDRAITFISPIETATGIQKEVKLSLSEQLPQATITHRLINHNLWAVEAAAWGLSVMRDGGEGFALLPPRRTHAECLVPTSALILWAYTDLADPRYHFSPRFLRLRQDANVDTPQKIGVNSSEGICGYQWRDLLFVKQIEVDNTAVYPDMGSRLELFTDRNMLEVESLSPLVKIEPQTAVVHTETWSLFSNLPENLTDDQLLEQLRLVGYTNR